MAENLSGHSTEHTSTEHDAGPVKDTEDSALMLPMLTAATVNS